MISGVTAQLIDWMHLLILHKKHQGLDIFNFCLFYLFLFILFGIGWIALLFYDTHASGRPFVITTIIATFLCLGTTVVPIQWDIE